MYVDALPFTVSLVKSLSGWVTAVAGFGMILGGPSLRWTSWGVRPSLYMEDPLLPLGY